MPRALNPRNEYPEDWDEIGDRARAEAGNRCVRCNHPYTAKASGNGQWSPCDERCSHGGPLAYLIGEPRIPCPFNSLGSAGDLVEVERLTGMLRPVVAEWRILTVHHLDGDKANCVWWNLLPLCQRCHLQVQSRVNPEQPYMLEHSEWFKPYVAGFYAKKYEGRLISREEALARLDELLAHERLA